MGVSGFDPGMTEHESPSGLSVPLKMAPSLEGLHHSYKIEVMVDCIETFLMLRLSCYFSDNV